MSLYIKSTTKSSLPHSALDFTFEMLPTYQALECVTVRYTTWNINVCVCALVPTQTAVASVSVRVHDCVVFAPTPSVFQQPQRVHSVFVVCVT